MATTATLADFEQLLQAARQQDEPQRLLFVFTHRELDKHATTAQRESFARGESGHLQPCLCVDKMPDEIASFAMLVAESEQTGQPWDIVFLGGIEGLGGELAAFDSSGRPLRFV